MRSMSVLDGEKGKHAASESDDGVPGLNSWIDNEFARSGRVEARPRIFEAYRISWELKAGSGRWLRNIVARRPLQPEFLHPAPERVWVHVENASGASRTLDD